MGNTYYISTTGSDANTGVTPGQAIRTFTRLSQLMQATDVAYIAPGTYTYTTHGRFSPTNTGTSIISQAFKLLGDTTGAIFGVSPGPVIWDGTGQNRAIALISTWSGYLIVKNIEFKNWSSVYNPSTTASIGSILGSDSTYTVIVDIEDCKGTNLGSAVGNADGRHDAAIVYMSLANQFCKLNVRNCDFTVTEASTSNVISLFTLVPQFAVSYNNASNLPQIVIEDCKISTTGAAIPFRIGNYYLNGTLMPSAQAPNTRLGILLKNVQMYRAAKGISPSYMLGTLISSSNTTDVFIEDSFIAAPIGIVATNGNNASKRLKITGSHMVGGFLANGNYQTIELENTRVDVFSGYTKLIADGNTNNRIVVKKCVLVSNPMAQVITPFAQNGYHSVEFEDCMFFGCSLGGAGSSSPTTSVTLRRVILANTPGDGSNRIVHLQGSGKMADCVFTRTTSASVLVYALETTTGMLSVLNASYSIPPQTTITGVPSYSIVSTNISGYSNHIDANMPDIAVPEMLNPMSGNRSLLIPVCGTGSATLKVVLEKDRVNTISIQCRKSWTGGTLRFWIEGTSFDAANVTTDQTVNIDFIPKRTGFHEIRVHGLDGTAATPYDSVATLNTILIDSVTVTGA